MSELTTVARPYARAAFEFAVANNNILAWADMLKFAANVATDATIIKLLKSDKATQELVDLFITVCGDQLDLHGQNLIKLMAENGRLSVLPRVTELYSDLVNTHNLETDVQVFSAYELTDEQKNELSISLEKRLARKVNINCSIDKALIAGMVIVAGDLVIDSSALGQLNRLSNTLQS